MHKFQKLNESKAPVNYWNWQGFKNLKPLNDKDDPEGWYGEGGGRRVQDGEHMYNFF